MNLFTVSKSPPTLALKQLRELKIPENEVIKITSKGRRFSLRFKRALWELNAHHCCYCGALIDTHKSMHVDHLHPRSGGGTSKLTNLVCACARCNTVKGENDIEHLRVALALSSSAISGVINVSQARELMSKGVSLPITLDLFHFERSCA
ncbi:HNH endonuclease [Serratia ureilytica]|uniref:HNH endonuclease n=1 Tax=Serratia ureilytica TaxID=300181 RepID=UPI0018D95BB7|nr:HNH endonuclease signature motif containing protein [Serratia ureilytica]MBH3122436.1 HNH endonuclease [Serratia ureilytica]